MESKKRIKVVDRPILDKVVLPAQRFFHIEQSSGILLLAAAIIALIWANSPWGHTYTSLWEQKITVGAGDFLLSKPLLLWINDGLMAIFFFVVGLEIKRELIIGELSTFKNALLPVITAIGGMVVPAIIYVSINMNPETINGWGIPMATDIAFALGVLSLLGKNVPLSLRVFLTAVAIIDDLGAILVIAIFYSTNISLLMLGLAGITLLILIILNLLHVRSPLVYLLFGIVLWFLFLKSGVHSTIAGVLLAFTIPAKARINSKHFYETTMSVLDRIKESGILSKETSVSSEIHDHTYTIEEHCEKVTSPAQRLEHKLHPYVAFFIMPVFALANAGISFSGDTEIINSISIGIFLGLIFGKAIGVTLFTYIPVKLKISDMPASTNIGHIIGVAFLAGIGFTMSIFITSLAFKNIDFINTAKAGILAASLIAGIIGYIILKRSKPAV